MAFLDRHYIEVFGCNHTGFGDFSYASNVLQLKCWTRSGFHKLIMCLPDLALNGLFLKVPVIFSVILNVGTMCLLDNLADSAICGGLQTATPYQKKNLG